jgi:hypothetical protein
MLWEIDVLNRIPSLIKDSAWSQVERFHLTKKPIELGRRLKAVMSLGGASHQTPTFTDF